MFKWGKGCVSSPKQIRASHGNKLRNLAMFADERHSGQWWAFEWATWCPSTASHHFPQKPTRLPGFPKKPKKAQLPAILLLLTCNWA